MDILYGKIKEELAAIINDIRNDKYYAEVIGKLDDMYASYRDHIQVMFMGGFSVGKSSLINAILKRNIADISAVPTTSAIPLADMYCQGIPAFRHCYTGSRSPVCS